MNALGTHLILELKECSRPLLDDLAHIRRTLLEAVEACGASVVGETFHKFSPYGVTGVVAIAESHLCIHTWPEHGYAAVDIFTCGENVDPHKAASAIIRGLQARDPSLIELRRGLLTEGVPVGALVRG
ncbi:MAG: adenosylmethionine decarboxylase [Chloroflexi bacterium]|nr:adenosylmethionine decarboxylase [Chloroflexota bacterium]